MFGLSEPRLLRLSCLLPTLLLLIPVATMTGCGGGAGTETVEEAVEERPRRRKTSRTSTETKSQRQTQVARRQDGLQGVPFDVWPEVYAAPKDVTADVVTPPEGKPGTTNPTPEPGTTPTTPTPTPKVPDTTPDTTPKPATKTPTAVVGNVNWGDLISGEELDGEAKALRNILTRSTTTMGQFRRTQKEIGAAGATLALVAMIAKQHPEDIRWKEKAGFVRGIGTTIATAAGEEASRMEWEKTQIAVEAFGRVMSGSTPAGEAPGDVPLDEAINFAGIMRRMQALYDSIRTDGSSADDFKANKVELKQRTAMLTAIVQGITHKDFALAAEPEYVTAAQAIIAAGKEMRNTFATDNFEGFSDALGRINGSCSSCHQKFKQ
ncbi:MAG: hypothetical protein O3A00_13375 [Planctomycetota bacterium]|nr:hypothetical protein [Planctomycetota bacterium]